MRIPESELIINADGSAFHLHIRPDQLADTVILVGDRSRVEMFKKYLTDIESETSSREFVSVTGKFNSKRFTVLSTGIGIGNIDIVMNELDALANIDFQTREIKPEHKQLTILRVGTCGAVQPYIPIGSYIYSEISIGTDGIMNWYGDREKFTDTAMEEAFKQQIKASPYIGTPYFAKNSVRLMELFKDRAVTGMTVAAPGFYGPQGRVLRMPLAMPDMIEDIESFRYQDKRIVNFEMEGSAIAAMGHLLGHDTGTICCAIANRHLKSSNTDYKILVDGLIRLVLERLSL